MTKVRLSGWLLLLVNCLMLGITPGSTGIEESPEAPEISSPREAAITIRAAGRGGPQLNLTDSEVDSLLRFLEYAGRTGTFPPRKENLRGFNN